MSEASPGHQAAAHARRGIGRAMMAIRDIPVGFDREPLGHTLRRAVQCCYAVLDSDVVARVHYDGLTEARSLVLAARDQLNAVSEQPLASIDRATEDLKLALSALSLGIEHVAQVHLARRLELHGGRWDEVLPPSKPFVASEGTPRCHAIARQPMAPPISLDPSFELPNIQDLPPGHAEVPTTIDELVALKARVAPVPTEPTLQQVAPGPVEPIYVYVPPSTERSWLSRLGRTLLEDVAIGHALREPNPNETWLDIRPFEDTMLARIDAFIAFGDPVLPLISLYHAEADAPDEGRAFAAALVLGSIDGADTVGAAAAMMQCSQPEELPGWTAGFALAPSEHIRSVMEELARHERADLAATAVSVLAQRGELRDEIAAALCLRDEHEVTRALTRALRGALPREEAVSALTEWSADPRLAYDACATLVIRDLGVGRSRILELLGQFETVVDDALHHLLCLAGNHSDAQRLFRWAGAQPSPIKARGLGRFGHSGCMDLLLEMFDAEDPELSDACAEALERVTGAGLFETVEVPWDFELPPEVLEASEVPVPMRQVTRPTRDRVVWERWIHQHRNRFDAAVRYRAGQPYTLLHVVGELESALTPPARRPEVALELAIRIDAGLAFDTRDWVARQQRDLAEITAHVEGVHYPAGSWAVAVAMPTAPPEVSSSPIDLGGTLMGVIRGPGTALPFAGGRTPTSRRPRPADDGDVLPFAGRDAAAPVADPSPVVKEMPPPATTSSAPRIIPVAGADDAPPKPDLDPLSVTLDGSSAPPTSASARSATPFEGGGSRPKPKRDEILPVATPFDGNARARGPEGATKSPQASAAAPRMSLEVYAWLCVREPYGAAYFTRALAMCGVEGLVPWQRWKGFWGARLAVDPALRARWTQLVEQQRAALRRS